MNKKEYNLNYRRSIKGLVKYIYAHQIRNCQVRGHNLPEYSSNELYKWFTSNNQALQVYNSWVKTGYDNEYKPSIDRLDNSKTYSFSNIECVTWYENKQRAYKGIRDNTIKTSSLLNNGHRPVCQFDLDLNKIATFISLSEANRLTGIDHRGISRCCKEEKVAYKNYLWCYANREKEFLSRFNSDYLEKVKSKHRQGQKFVISVNYEDGKVTELSTAEVSRLLGISPHLVRKILKNQYSFELPKHIKSIHLKDNN